MNLYSLLFAFFTLIYSGTMAQSPVDGKAVILFKDTVNMRLHVNFHTSNPELVAASQNADDGTIEELKINTAVVSAFYENARWYKFKDLKNGYKDSEIMRNACVALIAGTDSLGLFEFTNEQAVRSYYIQTPKDGRLIYNIEHPYVAGDFKSFSLLRFIKCKVLADKISVKEPAYYYEEQGSTQAEKLTVWKNIIATYYSNCQK